MISLKSMITADTLNTHKQTRGRLISIALIAFAVCIKVFTFRFGVLDELWQYDFCRAITMGYIPYKDFPFISMPLFYYIFAFPLLFSRTLFAYRVMTAVFFIAMLALMYFVIEKDTSAGYAVSVCLFAARFIELATYNMVMMFWGLCAYASLRIKDIGKQYFLVGFFSVLSTLTKQTSGGIMLILISAFMVYKAIKIDRKKSLILFYLSGIAVPCFVFLIYLLATSSFNDFWQCCFFGLFAFGGDNGAVYLEGTGLMIAVIIAGITCDICLFLKKKDLSYCFHMLAGLAALSNIIPIVDYYHLVIPGIFFLIPIASVIKEYVPSFIHINLTPVICSMIMAIVIIVSFDTFISPGFSIKWPELRMIPGTEDVAWYSEISDINSRYESEGKKVTVLSASAVTFSVMNGSFNPPFDMFLVGNFGTNDPMDYISDICSSSDSIILMPDDYITENPQNPDGVYEYITSHCTPVSSMGEWVWYTPNTAQED